MTSPTSLPGVPLETLIIRGASESPVLVLLHGRGSNEQDLITLGPMIAPNATIVSPRAPFPGAPWGYGHGYAWYRFLRDTTPEPESFEAGQQQLLNYVNALAAALEHPAEQMVVGGFSQGATSSLGLALRNPGLVRGVMMFSGFLADHPSIRATPDTCAGLPVFWGHGTHDPAIPFEFGKRGWDALRNAGAEVDARTYEGAGHTITRDEVREAGGWMASLVVSR